MDPSQVVWKQNAERLKGPGRIELQMGRRDEVARAIRRHKRKLARIVVDHWLHKARLRLLILRLQKVQQKLLKSLCLQKMRQFVVKNVEKREKKQISMSFNLSSTKKQGLHAWIAFFQSQIKRQRAASQLSYSVRRRICTSGFCTWYEHAKEHILQRRQLLIANHFWRLSLLSTFFVNWRIGVQNSHRKKYLERLALGFWAHKKLSISLQAFKLSMNMRHTVIIFSKKRKQRLMTLVFQHWQQIVAQDWKRLQKSAICLCNTSKLQRSLKVLCDYVWLKKRYKEMRLKAFEFQYSWCMCCTFKAWHDYAAKKQDRKRLAASAKRHFEKKLLRSTLSRWYGQIQIPAQSKEDYGSAWYKCRLCSKSISIWKEHMRKGGRHCKDLSLLHMQTLNICRLPHLVKLLQSQNRWLQQIYHFRITSGKTTWRRFIRSRRIKSIIVSQAQAFYKRCIQELKHSAWKLMDPNRLESTYNPMPMTQPQPSSEQKACDPVERPLFSNVVAQCKEEAGCSTSNIAARFPCTDKARTVQDTSMYTRKGRETRRSRLPPRRPLYLSDQLNLPDNCGKDHADVSLSQKPNSLCQVASETKYREGLPKTSGGVNWPGYTCEQKIVLQHMLTHGRNSKVETPANINLDLLSFTTKEDSINIAFQKRLSDPKLITEELVWTEELLCSFDNLREEIYQKGAELSVLREGHKLGEEYKAERVRYLEQKIMALQQRRALLLPTIQGLASRAGALGRMLSNTGSQVLHLD